MAKLDKQTIEKLTKLSRINCSEQEQEAILNDLQKILQYMEQLQEINTENVSPCNHVLADMINIERKDEIGPTLKRESFLSNAASHTGGYIRVPPILKNE